MTAPALITLDAVVAGYAQPVVGPTSFTIAPGEVVGLQGPNGAGKSTLLRAITRSVRVFQGTIRRAPDLTVAHHRQRPERPPELPLLARELLRLTGADEHPPHSLADVLDRRLAELSGGQFQFLQTWACLAGPERLVLLDEPTNNLDGAGIDGLLRRLKRIETHRAVLLVSHEADFLRRACNRIVVV